MSIPSRTHLTAALRVWVVLVFLAGLRMRVDAEVSIPPGAQRGSDSPKKAHWAFQTLQRPAVPSTDSTAVSLSGSVPSPALQRGSGNPIDAFVRSLLASKKLSANPRATRRELIRRATYDLTGLPPTLGEVERFVTDADPQAWERLIERLLSSPRYGEKWGRHWLDLVRFAESNSYERDGAKPHAWRYRDYVIRSFNADTPYDRFVQEQLAGDELAAAMPEGGTEALIATGFYRLGIWDDEPADRELAKYDALDDLVTTTGQVFLGLTIDCARCHNHKLDPIPQRDYYRLLAFFKNISPYRNGGPTDEAAIFANGAERAAYVAKVREIETQRAELETVVAKAEAQFRAHLAASGDAEKVTATTFEERWKKEGILALGAEMFQQHQEARRVLGTLRADSIPVEKALVVSEAGSEAPETFVLSRGNPAAPGEKVEPGFPAVLGSPEPPVSTGMKGARTTGLRSLLADWIVSDKNPIAARVMVNRIWQHHFGRGLVRSPNNFGLNGDAPTHPELLDWLACEFWEKGWSLKAMHRLIMASETYRMSSEGREEALKADPANDTLWRFDMRRLTAEEIRDTVLSVTGSLNLKMYGPGVYVEIPAEVLAGQSQPGNGWGNSSPSEQARRSLYIHAKRSLLTPILESFDMAETDRSAPVRFTTVQPTQALGTLNGSFLNRQARLFSDNLRSELGQNTRLLVQRALHLCTAREPTVDEVERGVRFIQGSCVDERLSPEAALAQFCLLALNLNELVYLD